MLRVPGPQTRERLTTMTCNGVEAASLFGKTRKNPKMEGKGNLITGKQANREFYTDVQINTATDM